MLILSKMAFAGTVSQQEEDLRLQYVEEGRVEGTAEGREGESSRDETPI